MKNITGLKTLIEQKKKMEELGWIYYELSFQNRMCKKIDGIGELDVCLRSFGKFFVYDENGECIGSESSFELDGEKWYDEILDIIYEGDYIC